MDHKNDELYIMEEYVRGYVQTFDAIVDSKGQPLFESGNITPESIMDIVNDNRDSTYYLVKDVPENIRSAGLRTVKAFGVKSRFIHLEFFVLSEDQAGLALICRAWFSLFGISSPPILSSSRRCRCPRK